MVDELKISLYVINKYLMRGNEDDRDRSLSGLQWKGKR